MSKLFRDEAIVGVTELKWGRPISLIPPSWWWMTLFFAVLAGAAITFLALATFVRKETVPGVLALSRGELRIVAPRTGIIQEVYVQDGQAVDQGAPLVLISTEQQLAGGAIVDARVLRAIDDEQTMLKAQLDALDASTPLNERSVAERLRGTQNQIAELTKAIPGRVERVAIARQAADIAQQLLDKGVMTATDARQRRTELLIQEQSLSDLRTQISQLQGQAAETAASLAKLPSDAAQTRAGIQQQIVALEEKRATASGQNGFVLSARVAGRVTALQAIAGQPADPAKPLMTVVPDDSVLEAEIYVPSRAIGFIEPSQHVRLLYDAFPHERFGPAAGTIARISGSALKPDELAGAVSVKEPVYPVTVALGKTTISAYGKEVPLLPGMAVTADILLEERSFLRLLFDPLLAARGRVLGDG